jgi:hypothetical protein
VAQQHHQKTVERRRGGRNPKPSRDNPKRKAQHCINNQGGEGLHKTISKEKIQEAAPQDIQEEVH